MDTTQQDILANSILVLFVSILLGVMFLFASWAGSKVTSARWPHAKIAWSLLAIGGVGMMLGLALSAVAGLIPSQVSSSPGVGSWMQQASIIGFQIGMILALTSVSWLWFLRMRYPLDPSRPVDRDRRRRDIAGESLVIALTVGYVVLVLTGWTSWTSSFMVAIGVSFAAFVLTLVITPFLLDRVLRQRRTRG